MKNRFFFFSLFCLSTVLPQINHAQTVKMSAKCGDILEGEFKNSTESQDIELSMNAGDAFEVTVIPVGKHLKVRLEIYDPGIQPIETETSGDVMFGDESIRSLVVNSGTLSSNGKYRIRLYNFYAYPANTGAYTAYIKCVKKNGDIINPK